MAPFLPKVIYFLSGLKLLLNKVGLSLRLSLADDVEDSVDDDDFIVDEEEEEDQENKDLTRKYLRGKFIFF